MCQVEWWGDWVGGVDVLSIGVAWGVVDRVLLHPPLDWFVFVSQAESLFAPVCEGRPFLEVLEGGYCFEEGLVVPNPG